MDNNKLEEISQKYMHGVIDELSTAGFVSSRDLIHFAEYLISFGIFIKQNTEQFEDEQFEDKPEVKH